MRGARSAWVPLIVAVVVAACAPAVTGGPEAMSFAEAKVVVGRLDVGMPEETARGLLGSPGGRLTVNCPRHVGAGRCLRWTYTWRPTRLCGRVGDHLSCVQTQQQRLRLWFIPAGEDWALAAWNWL
jgi:hypothetical protein